jgi:hypothetical protein
MGVELVGPPARLVVDGALRSRIVCFKDPDGTVLELVEVHGARELIRPAGTRSQGK